MHVINYAIGENQPNGDLATPNSHLRAIQLWYIMPALPNSSDGRVKGQQRFVSVESADIVPPQYT